MRLRAAQAGLSAGIGAALFLHPTDLRLQAEEGSLLAPLCFVGLILSSVALYFVVSLMDPGFVRSHPEHTKESGSKGQEILAFQQDVPEVRLRRCGYCLLKQPMRAKHCRECRHCVRRYDHHCPWIENCVGERNHRLFVLYLAVQLVVVVWAMEASWSGLGPLPASFSWPWLRQNLLLLLCFLVLLVCAVVAALLLASHAYLAACNTTTWEFMSRHRISYLRGCPEEENPFDRGVFRNLWGFFCARRSVRWEALHPSAV
ncbi:palmitoyltransferase ZDHHC12 isoform X2 [Anolis carolinensis]|uniref:palmitoyltransferase ZDHHC12 isoform X2 n=1 Tax=Anolis carolinensis TaxID=28377 RepID=UPI002F2B554E